MGRRLAKDFSGQQLTAFDLLYYIMITVNTDKRKLLKYNDKSHDKNKFRKDIFADYA